MNAVIAFIARVYCAALSSSVLCVCARALRVPPCTVRRSLLLFAHCARTVARVHSYLRSFVRSLVHSFAQEQNSCMRESVGKRVHERDWSGVGWGDGAKKMLLAFYVCLVYYFVVHRYAYCCCSNADKHAGSLGKSISNATWQQAVREREREKRFNFCIALH